MKKRSLKHHINWQNTWKEMRKERTGKFKISCDDDFFKKSADCFYRQIKANDYEFGRKAVEKLSGIINSDFNVLEIGAGPGSLTIPLAKRVNKVYSIEFSKKAVKQLELNLLEEKLENVEIINKNWSDLNDEEIKGKYDLVVCSHFLWQMQDLAKLITRMERASRSCCAIIQPCGRDETAKEVFEEVSNVEYTGQFEPDADYFAYLILREWGRLVSVMPYNYTFERNLDEEIRYIAAFVGRFMEVNQEVIEKIRKRLLSKSETGVYIDKNKAVVMWW